MTSVLTRIFGPGNLDLVEEVVQDAMVRALEVWPYTGVPDRPIPWLVQAAKNRAINVLRRQRLWSEKVEDDLSAWQAEFAGAPEVTLHAGHFRDDVVAMLFMCCHPDIPGDGRAALALKAVAGFSVGEIARAFLAEESTVAQRIVRAKRRIRDQGLAFEMPGGTELHARLDTVLEVLYLWFNEGYLAHAGPDLMRIDLCEEAIRLGCLVAECPATDRPRSHALVSLMALQAARFPARMDSEGNILLLRDQERSLWDARLLRFGFDHLEQSSSGDEVSPFHVEAGIASCHAAAASYEETDWRRIVELYDELLRLKPSPLIALNRAVAASRLTGPRAAIEAIEPLQEEVRLRRYHLLPAVLADLWVEAGDRFEAARFYRQALAQPCSDPERRFLTQRLALLE